MLENGQFSTDAPQFREGDEVTVFLADGKTLNLKVVDLAMSQRKKPLPCSPGPNRSSRK